MISRGALLGAGLLCVAAQSFAQMPQPGRDPLAEHLFPPELIMQHQNALGLTEEQKGAIRGEIGKAQGRFLDIQWQLQAAVESLVALVKQPTADETEVMTRLDKVLTLERDIKRAQLELLVRIKNRLNADQQAKLRQLRPSPPAR